MMPPSPRQPGRNHSTAIHAAQSGSNPHPVCAIFTQNERPSPFGRRQPGYQSPPHPPVNEDTLKFEQVQIERKTFVFLPKENARGRFLRIIEENGRHSDSIIIPSAGLETFQKLMGEMVTASEELPPKDLVQQSGV